MEHRDITVVVNLQKPTGSVGTWYPLFLVVDSTATDTVYGEYTELSEIVTAGYDDKSNVYNAVNLMLSQNRKPSEFAILKLKAFSTSEIDKYVNKSWRQLVFVDAGSNVADMATYIENTDKMLFLTVSSKTELQALSAKVKTFDRTFILYDPNGTNSVAAVVGATAGLAAGSFTYKNTVLKGVIALDISTTELEEIHELGANAILEKAGDIVTSEGKVASGEYADVVDGNDFTAQNISYYNQKVFNNNDKVPYTDAGISLLEDATLSALNLSIANGIIAKDADGEPIYSIDFKPRSETTASDRTDRNYPYGTVSYELAGAIHIAKVTVAITL